MNYCDECIHFVPNEGRKNLSILCAKKHELKFKEPKDWMKLLTFDYGFHCTGCKDFQKKEKIDYSTWTVYINEDNLKNSHNGRNKN